MHIWGENSLSTHISHPNLSKGLTYIMREREKERKEKKCHSETEQHGEKETHTEKDRDRGNETDIGFL